MLEDSYISFEQAKLLKEKGFPQWSPDDSDKEAYDCEGNIDCMRYFDQNPQDYYSLATLSLVQKWLREEKCIDVLINQTTDNRYYINVNDHIKEPNIWSRKYYNRYEEALSAGIDKTLKLI